MPLPGMHDPLDTDVGRVVRILRALPPGPAPVAARDAVLAFVDAVTADRASTTAGLHGEGTAGPLEQHLETLGGATLASVVVAVVFDAAHADTAGLGEGQNRQGAILAALADLRSALTDRSSADPSSTDSSSADPSDAAT